MSMMRVVSDVRAKSILDYYTNQMCYSIGRQQMKCEAQAEIVVDACMAVSGWMQ